MRFGNCLAVAAAGIRYKNRDDLLLIELGGGACAAVFTRNAFLCGAGDGRARAPGEGADPLPADQLRQCQCRHRCAGLRAARETCRLLAGMAGCAMSQVMPFSTGVIGQDLPVDPFAGLSRRCCQGCAKTTGHSPLLRS